MATYNLQRTGRNVSELFDKAEGLPDANALAEELAGIKNEANKYTDEQTKLAVLSDTTGITLTDTGAELGGGKIFELKENNLTPVVIANAYQAQKATLDGDENVIADTYAKKEEIQSISTDIYQFNAKVTLNTETVTSDVTYDELMEQMEDGKTLVGNFEIVDTSQKNVVVAVMSHCYPTGFEASFCDLNQEGVMWFVGLSNSNAWTFAYSQVEFANLNKATTITDDTTNDTNYPTTKAVADYVDSAKEVFMFEGTISGGYPTYTFTTDTTYDTIFEEYNKGKLILCKASIDENFYTIIPMVEKIYDYVDGENTVALRGIGHFEVPEDGQYSISIHKNNTWKCLYLNNYETQANKLAQAWTEGVVEENDVDKYPSICAMTTYVEAKNYTLTQKLEMYGTADIEITPIDCFTYTKSDNSVTITGFSASAKTAQQKNPVIPFEIDEYPVTALGDSSFAYNTNIESVIMPNSIVNGGNRAFESCSGLTSIKLSDNLKIIGSYFLYGTKITEIELSESLTEIGERAFENCSQLYKNSDKMLVIPEAVTHIGSYAFKDIGSENIRFENTTTKITIDDLENWKGFLTNTFFHSGSYVEKCALMRYTSSNWHYIDGEVPSFRIIYNPVTGDIGAYGLDTANESIEVGYGFVDNTMKNGATILNVIITNDSTLSYNVDSVLVKTQIKFKGTKSTDQWTANFYYDKFNYEINIDFGALDIWSARRFENMEANEVHYDNAHNFTFTYQPTGIQFNAVDGRGNKFYPAVNNAINAEYATNADNAEYATKAKYAEYYAYTGIQSIYTIEQTFEQKSDKTTFSTVTPADFGDGVPRVYVNFYNNLSTTVTESADYGSDLIIHFSVITSDLVDGYISGVVFTTGETAPTLTVPTEIKFSGADCLDGSFVPTANKQYEVIISRVGDNLWGDVDARDIEVSTDE